MTQFTSEFITQQKKLLQFPLMPSKGHWVEIDGRMLVGCGEYDAETNSSNCAPYLTVEIENDAETVKNCVLYYREALDEIERQRDLISAYENDLVLLSVCGKLKRLESEIKESNDLLRSAFMLAKRDGEGTNWEAWRKQLEIALARQHAIIYGKD